MDRSYKNAFFYYSFSDCAYIEGLETRFHYAAIEQCKEEFYNALLERGWRRFGEMFFAPFCDFCNRCVSIRYLVGDFKPSKNHKRILRKNAHIRTEFKSPSYHIDKVALYNKYHSQMNIKKGWEYNQIDRDKYNYMFVDGRGGFGKEICFFEGERLVAVALVDILSAFRAMSAIYFFYDHDYANLSLGTFSILKQFEIAQDLGVKYLYPGYWIQNHGSLGYKERFKPFEYLVNRPNLYEMPMWRAYSE